MTDTYASTFVALVDMLRRDQGNTVTLMCENEEGDGLDNESVEVCADWTGWKDKRFYGNTVLGALQNAVTAMQEAKKHPLPEFPAEATVILNLSMREIHMLLDAKPDLELSHKFAKALAKAELQLGGKA